MFLSIRVITQIISARIIRKINFPTKKPSGKYFKGLSKTLLEKDLMDRLFIFIDDNIENVKAAIKKGFVAIHFETAEQTERDLQSLGITF